MIHSKTYQQICAKEPTNSATQSYPAHNRWSMRWSFLPLFHQPWRTSRGTPRARAGDSSLHFDRTRGKSPPNRQCSAGAPCPRALHTQSAWAARSCNAGHVTRLFFLKNHFFIIFLSKKSFFYHFNVVQKSFLSFLRRFQYIFPFCCRVESPASGAIGWRPCSVHHGNENNVVSLISHRNSLTKISKRCILNDQALWLSAFYGISMLTIGDDLFTTYFTAQNGHVSKQNFSRICSKFGDNPNKK